MMNEKTPPFNSSMNNPMNNVILLHISDDGNVIMEVLTKQEFSDRVSDDEETETSYYGRNVKFAASFEQLVNNPQRDVTMLLAIKGEIVIPRLKKKYDID